MASIVGTPLNLNLGESYTDEAGSNRLVILVPLVSNTGVAATITALSMGGVAAEEAVQYCELGSEWGMEGIYFIREANIPSGAQVLAGTTSAGTIIDVACYTLDGMDQTDPVQQSGSMESISANSAIANLTGAIAGDINIIAGHGAQAAMFATYSNSYIEDVRDQQASAVWISASKVLVGGDTNDDCTMTTGATSGRKSCCWAVFAQASGSTSDTPISVDSSDMVAEGANVTLLAEDAYVLPVLPGELVGEGQEIPFILTDIGTAAEGVGEGSDIGQTYSIDVASADLVGEGSEITFAVGGNSTITVESSDMVASPSNITLTPTGIESTEENITQEMISSMAKKMTYTMTDMTQEV
jgi:hypothetical protein